MDNGVDIVDGTSLAAYEEKVDEGVIFEDAMNAEEHFLEQRMESDSIDDVVKKGEEHLAGDSEPSVAYENPDSLNELDKFEEAMDALSLAGENKEEVTDEVEPTLITAKGEDVGGGSSVLEPVDEEGSKEIVKSEFNQLQNGLNGYKDWEFSEVGARNEGEILDGIDDVKSGVAITESEINPVDENLEELVTIDETVNSIGTGKEEEDDLYGHRVIESNKKILDEVDDENERNKNESAKLNDNYNLINIDAKFADKESEECEDSIATTESRARNEEGEDLNCSSAPEREEHTDCNVNEVSNASVVVDSGNNGDTSDTSAVNLERNGEMCKVKNNSAELPETVDEREVQVQNGTSNEKIANIQDVKIGLTATELPETVDGREVQVQNGTSNENIANIQDVKTGLIATELPETVDGREVQVQNGTSNEKIANIKDIKTGLIATDNQTDKIQQLDDYDKYSISVEKLKMTERKVQEESQGTLNTEVGIQPSSVLPSSSEKVSNPAPSPARPAGLGRAAPLLEPALRTAQQPRVNGTFSHMQSQQIEDSSNGEADEKDETREKLQMIRVKFLRLAHRLGQTPHNGVVAQVLYRLGLAEQLQGRNGGRVGAFSFDRASAMAEQLEAAGQEPLDFSCTIMVLGKTGVGKSATINSIFNEVKFGTDAFQMGTKKVQDAVGTVQGIEVRVIDTPGLMLSWSDQHQNEKNLLSVKRFIKKTPPDIVLYLDRLDVQNRDFSDMPLLHTITEIFGPSIWFNAIVVFTHAASAPPDGPNGTATSYDMFVTQRSHVVQQAIRQAAGDIRLMNPVSLVENHSACRTNRAGQRVLPNGQVWKPHLLLLSFASKILAEANALLKLQDSSPGRPFTARSRAPPLPFLLSSLLQSRPQVKLPDEQFVDGDDLEDELDESSDSEDESEYDELPPFKRLTKAQVEKLSKAQKKAYFDELEYREKLFMKKQLKEEKRQRKMMRKMAAQVRELPSDYTENREEESNGAASVPVPMPDLALPASFDSDNPTHRYRFLDSSNQWLIRPVLETHGWDHDVGYEGINVEKLFVVKEKIPLSFLGQVTKDKKDANIQMEMTSSIKHGDGKATSFGFDMQTVGKDLAYTLRGERIFCNFWKNKAIAGISATLLGDALSAGVKIEDKLIASKRFRLVIAGGAMTSRGDVAYGGSLEAQLRDKEYPLGRSLSTLGLSIMDWHGDLAIGCNIQSQIPVGRSTTLIGRANLNNRGAGQVSIRLNSSEQLQIALIGLVPLVKKILGYPQQL